MGKEEGDGVIEDEDRDRDLDQIGHTYNIEEESGDIALLSSGIADPSVQYENDTRIGNLEKTLYIITNNWPLIPPLMKYFT